MDEVLSSFIVVVATEESRISGVIEVLGMKRIDDVDHMVFLEDEVIAEGFGEHQVEHVALG